MVLFLFLLWNGLHFFTLASGFPDQILYVSRYSYRVKCVYFQQYISQQCLLPFRFCSFELFDPISISFLPPASPFILLMNMYRFTTGGDLSNSHVPFGLAAQIEKNPPRFLHGRENRPLSLPLPPASPFILLMNMYRCTTGGDLSNPHVPFGLAAGVDRKKTSTLLQHGRENKWRQYLVV